MLTSDLLRARMYKGEVRPRYIDPRSEELLGLAGRLIELFSEHVGHRRQELEHELRELLGTGTEFLLHRGLAKLLRDRCEFVVDAPAEPTELRLALFGRAAEAYGAPAVETAFHLDRQAVVTAAADEAGLSAEALERALYADLQQEQVMESFEACKPAWLLGRYNVALAQGVLLRASELEIEIALGGPRAARALFQRIKFFQLLHRVRRTPAGYRISLDGPLSLFQSSQKYGLQMASFLPTLLHFESWTLEGQVRWGPKRRPATFKLEAGKLAPYGHLPGRWQPEELQAFPAQFAKLDSGWAVDAEGELLELGGQGVLVPDFVFRHPESGFQATMEVLGFWRKGALASRLELLRRHGPPNLVLAISKRLAGEADGLDDLPSEIYLYRTTPIARQVLKLLEEMRRAAT